ncbi:MAG: ATP-binding protein [Clostridia bacterium]|nr:ATP-binding protein [Clostridia bacterium]
MALIEEIQSLIDLKTEGDYWDFKEMWHSNKACLLHDIICMANNQVGRDAYIIIGVSDSKSADGVLIKGISDTDPNRKDQQHLIDFLRNKKFAGSIRPTVYVQTFNTADDKGNTKAIDVIIIRNTPETPYFLTENFRDRDKEIRAGHIYTRIGDTNTAIDSFADMDKIEFLWRKRFGLDLSVKERLLLLLDRPNEWEGDFNWDNKKYHKMFPEFKIQIEEISDQAIETDNSIINNIADHQIDNKVVVGNLVISYHATALYEEKILYLDGYRILIPFPHSHTVSLDKYTTENESLTYVFFNYETISGKLFNCFAKTADNWYGEKWYLSPGIAFLWFEDNADQKMFDEYVKDHLYDIQQDYQNALMEKGLDRTNCPVDYFIGGWSKANEIKSWHLYEQYKGIRGTPLVDKLPNAHKQK